MAGVPSLEPSAACLFDRLSDEVLCEVLKRAAAYDGVFTAYFKDVQVCEDSNIWVGGNTVFQLTRVCRRFRELERSLATHVVWQFPRHVNTV